MAGDVLVFAESFGPSFRKASFEATTEGRQLADQLKVQVHVIAVGSGIKDHVGELGRYGADKIWVTDDPALSLFNPEYYRQIVLDLSKKIDPSIILVPATSAGKDLAPRIAIHLNTVVASECTQLELENGSLVATRPAIAGKVLVKLKVKTSPSIATLRPNVFTAKESPRNPTIEQVPFAKPESR
ncbi:MAG TPA: electron transfer flavoprotein subunit alpha/FixB family protein, partial [Candidatus Bathyarchaeia archaeon]|nr:electron transfer flavoprotein subunit alpha/FixB family protein [Candidatus Bathyarchaeia archaeon]